MQVEIYYDEVWPVMRCERTAYHDGPVYGELFDIDESLYDEWLAANKRVRELRAKIEQATGARPKGVL